MPISINTSYQSNINDLYARDIEQNSRTNQIAQTTQNQAEQTQQTDQVQFNPLRDQINQIRQQTEATSNNIAALQIADNALSRLSDDANRLLNNQIPQDEINNFMNSMQNTIDNASFNGQSVFGGTMIFANGNSLNLNAPNLNELNPNNQNSIENFTNNINATRANISDIQRNIAQSASEALQTLNTNVQNPVTNAIFNAHNPQILQTQISALIG